LGNAMKATGLGAEGGSRCLVARDQHTVSENQSQAVLTWKEAARKAPGRTRRLNMMWGE
jgi:hypothetical protein